MKQVKGWSKSQVEKLRGGLKKHIIKYNDKGPEDLMSIPEVLLGALDEIDYLRSSFEIIQEIIKQKAKSKGVTDHPEGRAVESTLLSILRMIENQLAVRTKELGL